MNGIDYTIPLSGSTIEKKTELPPICLLLGEKPKKPEVKKPIYVKIMNWDKNKTVKFSEIIK